MILRHEVAAELEVRSSGDGRTVTGIACPFGKPTQIREFGRSYTESFAYGAFAATIASGRTVKFLGLHNRQTFPLGRAISLREDRVGLIPELRVSKTQAGDEALELIRDGALDGLSVGFEPVTPRGDHYAAHIERTEVKLREISATPFPAYGDAVITEVRQEIEEEELDRAAEAMEMLRAGKALSSASMETLQTVLGHLATIDQHADAAQPILAKLMGVPNPDSGEGADEQDDDRSDTTPVATRSKPAGRPVAPTLARARLIGISVR